MATVGGETALGAAAGGVREPIQPLGQKPSGPLTHDVPPQTERESPSITPEAFFFCSSQFSLPYRLKLWICQYD